MQWDVVITSGIFELRDRKLSEAEKDEKTKNEKKEKKEGGRRRLR